MKARRSLKARAAALMSLEADAASARGGFACMFSTSDEYETALIRERRARGYYDRYHNRRYERPYGPWSIAMFIGCALIVAGMVALFG
jgi:hypothetical protein